MRWFAALIGLLAAPISAFAHESPAPAAALARAEAAVGNPLPDLAFRDGTGAIIKLGQLRGRPLLLSLVYTGCTDICPVLIESLAAAVEAGRSALGEDSFSVVTIGFDTRNDTPERMRSFARSHGIELPNWWFLAADQQSRDRLAEAVGFTFDPVAGGFEHTGLVTVVDKDGRIYRQVYGATFKPPAVIEPLKDLIFGRAQPILSLDGLLDRVRLFCTVYNPNTGRYYFNYTLFISLAIGTASLSLILVMLVREFRKTMATRKARP